MHSPVVLYKQEGNLNVWLRSLLKRFFCEWWCWFGTIVQAFEAWLDPLFAIIVAAAVLKGRWILLAKSEKSCGSSRRKVSRELLLVPPPVRATPRATRRADALCGAAATSLAAGAVLCKLLHKPSLLAFWVRLTTLSMNRRPEPINGIYGTFMQLDL